MYQQVVPCVTNMCRLKMALTATACSHVGNIGCRSSKAWELVSDWTPCAIGAVPCAFDSNGRQPALSAVQAAPSDQLGDSMKKQTCRSDPMAFAQQASMPGSRNVPNDILHLGDINMQPILAPTEPGSASKHEQSLYCDYWDRFEGHTLALEDSASQPRTHQCIALNRAVRVL